HYYRPVRLKILPRKSEVAEYKLYFSSIIIERRGKRFFFDCWNILRCPLLSNNRIGTWEVEYFRYRTGILIRNRMGNIPVVILNYPLVAQVLRISDRNTGSFCRHLMAKIEIRKLFNKPTLNYITVLQYGSIFNGRHCKLFNISTSIELYGFYGLILKPNMFVWRQMRASANGRNLFHIILPVIRNA